jgi:hypothetical protein
MPSRRARDTKKTDDCAHHWDIAIANGPVSQGTCRLCKAEREFMNSIFTDSQHITLAKEDNDRRRWNKWYGDNG